MSKHEFGMLSLAEDAMAEGFYPGLTGISAAQRLVYICMMTMNNGEFVLVQVDNAGDVDAVKAILNARIATMVDGGAWYPESTEIWTNSSRVVSNGNYVMMVVHPDCDTIVSEFNALF